MSDYINLFNEITSAGALALLIAMFGLFVLHAFAITTFNRVWSFIENYALQIALLLALGSVFGALVYSDVIGYKPCSLCLIQRLFMFPLPVVLAIGFIKRQWTGVVLKIALTLALLGAAVAIYHFAKDMLTLYAPAGTSATLGCPDIKGVPSCERIYFNYFGFITIPTISFVSFAWIAIACGAGLRKK